jgi:CheY-like chemotaxis protein/HPt (histidine-containing phosphotransfer) domain-containing protein
MVDDDPTIQKVGKAILEHCGCWVEVSGSGREAVEAFARKKFDMIFMDCHMPVMDGYVTTGVIREMENKNRGNSGANRVPIVALTGYSTEEDREECLRAGMDDYLSKPFTIAHIKSVLDRWLVARSAENREDRGEQGSSGMEAQAETAKGPNRQEEPPPIDRNTLDLIASLQPPGSDNILRKVISLYLDSSFALMKSVREALEGTDFDALHRAAHTLKSSSASLGALAFSGICKDLEMMGRDKTLGGAKDRLLALEHEYERVREALERHCTSLL